MEESVTKGLKQAKYVIDFLNEWKGSGSHSVSDVQAALLSVIQLSGLQRDAIIIDADPCRTDVITPTLCNVVPLESKQDLRFHPQSRTNFGSPLRAGEISEENRAARR
jgi:hypothetical protein